MSGAERTVLHVDMDAFYAAVEQHDRPELTGQPVVVGGAGGRGVVAAASYEVRKYGVHSAMPMREALRRCPQAVVVAPRFRRYREISAQVFEVFREFTDQVEGLSLDEAFLDVTASTGIFGDGEAMAREIKKRIRDRTGLAASVGVSHNKLLAKLASEMAKPDGMTVIRPPDVHAMLDPLPVGRLYGVGPKTAARLEEQGVLTLGQLRAAPESLLWPLLRRETRTFQDRAAGIDERPVVSDAPEKQISSEETFDVDIRDHEELQERLAQLADRTTARLRARQFKAGMVSIKVRRRDFETYTRQRSFNPPTQETRLIAQVAADLLDHWLAEQPRAAVRLLGVGVADLEPETQLDLFATPEFTASQRLDDALDRINGRFGEDAIHRGTDR
ncbi:MAG TPA: DNA polymerase IV [Steroidobacteraceae bacterium]|nr:DNA polymerase IV [Steroidobacteraceae bacterium]